MKWYPISAINCCDFFNWAGHITDSIASNQGHIMHLSYLLG
jgi:hypothetical protein